MPHKIVEIGQAVAGLRRDSAATSSECGIVYPAAGLGVSGSQWEVEIRGNVVQRSPGGVSTFVTAPLGQLAFSAALVRLCHTELRPLGDILQTDTEPLATQELFIHLTRGCVVPPESSAEAYLSVDPKQVVEPPSTDGADLAAALTDYCGKPVGVLLGQAKVSVSSNLVDAVLSLTQRFRTNAQRQAVAAGTPVPDYRPNDRTAGLRRDYLERTSTDGKHYLLAKNTVLLVFHPRGVGQGDLDVINRWNRAHPHRQLHVALWPAALGEADLLYSACNGKCLASGGFTARYQRVLQ